MSRHGTLPVVKVVGHALYVGAARGWDDARVDGHVVEPIHIVRKVVLGGRQTGRQGDNAVRPIQVPTVHVVDG